MSSFKFFRNFIDVNSPWEKPKRVAIVYLETRSLFVCLPALGVSSKSVRLVAERLGFYFRSGHTEDFKNSIRSCSGRRSAHPKVRRVLRMCCSSCRPMSLNSVQSFMIDNYNGAPIENGLNNECLHSLSRTLAFTLFCCVEIKTTNEKCDTSKILMIVTVNLRLH